MLSKARRLRWMKHKRRVEEPYRFGYGNRVVFWYFIYTSMDFIEIVKHWYSHAVTEKRSKKGGA